jgi:Right handed beta helix region
MNNYAKLRYGFTTAALVALAAVIFFARPSTARAGQAEAALVKCGSSITTCGCTITKPGYYEVDANLNYTQGLTPAGDCIDIKASKVILNLLGYEVYGNDKASPYVGVGVRVLKGSNKNFIEGDNSGIRHWNYGIELDGGNSIVEYFQTSYNGQAGVFVNKSNNNNINDFSSDYNTTFGVWLRGGKGNQVNCSDSSNNGVAGVYLGCSASGPSGAACKGTPNPKNNKIFDHNAASNGSYGIALSKGATGTILTDLGVHTNSTDDMFDENSNCDNNTWFDNNYSTANQGCIN